jgi:glycosyltransferase involved in cell wall biosynthesis
LNDPEGARQTIESVRKQDYPALEFIVIDGGSDAPTQSVYASNRDAINILISEPDRGIYDAMNKGLRASTSEWYIMMNAGDVFAEPSAIRDNMRLIAALDGATWGGGGSCIQYPDGSARNYFADPKLGIFHQQSLFIRRVLHEKYGYFVVNRASNAWDYFFFQLISNEPFASTNLLVSNCDGTGISSSVTNYLQVHAMAFLFGRQGRMKTAAVFVLYPIYRKLFSRALPYRRRQSHTNRCAALKQSL